MTVRFLADTSALVRLPKATVGDVLRPLIVEGAVALSPIVKLELLRFTRGPADYTQAVANLAGMPAEETGDKEIRRALWVQAELATRSEHRSVKIPDLLIAATAEAARLTVLHYDSDFDRISGVTGQPVQWVVARGSVD